MEEKENKRGSKKLIIFLSALVVMFAITSVLAFMEVFNVDTFRKNNKVENKTTVEKKDETAKKEVIKEETKETLYYQYLNETDHNGETLWNSKELILNEDGTAEYKYGGNASGGGYFKGKYMEDDKTIVAILDNVMPEGTVCNPNKILDTCRLVIVYNKTEGKLVSTEYNYTNDGVVENTTTLTKIEKNDLRLFNDNN